jgi:hypothetical protein
MYLRRTVINKLWSKKGTVISHMSLSYGEVYNSSKKEGFAMKGSEMGIECFFPLKVTVEILSLNVMFIRKQDLWEVIRS